MLFKNRFKIKMLKIDRILPSCAFAFALPCKNSASIVGPGSQPMAVIIGGNHTNSLVALRYQAFMKKVVTAKSFEHTELFLPIVSNTKFHHLREYYNPCIHN